MSFFDDLITNPAITDAMLPALGETLLMTGISSGATVALGLPLGVILFVTQPGGIAHRRFLNVLLSAVVNFTRSIPYAILMLALAPLALFIVGTRIGPIAASVSLSIASIPFFARLVEASLREVQPGKIDAAHAMGSTRFQTISKVLLPEALPAIIANITTTVVAIVGYTAMAGLVGGGGLGRLAYNYGYQRSQTEVMVVLIILLVILVQLIQVIGDALARRVDHR